MSLSPSLMDIVARLSAGGRPVEIPPTTLPSEREEMLDLIAAAAARDPEVRQIAVRLYVRLAEQLGRVPTRPELLQWLMDSVHLLIDYVPDEAGKEMFQSVQWTLGGRCGTTISPLTGSPKGCGDCEDQADLLVALALALGIRARVKWVDQPGYPLNHVSAIALLDDARPGDRGAWVCTDATIPGARPGESPVQALERVGPGFRSRVFGIEQAAGGVFAAGRAVPMRHRAAGDPAGNDVTSLVAQRASLARRWPGYPLYLGYQVNGEGEAVVPGSARFEYVTDPARDRELAPSVMGDDRFNFGVAVPVGGVAREVAVGYILGRPPTIEGIADDVPRGTMVETGVPHETTGGTGGVLVSNLRDAHDLALERRFAILRELDALTQRIRFLRTGVTIISPGTGGTAVGTVVPVEPPTLVVAHMPPWWRVSVGDSGLDVARGVWGADGLWRLALPDSLGGASQSVRIYPPEGTAGRTRIADLAIPAHGEAAIDFAAMPMQEPVRTLYILAIPPFSTISVGGVALDLTPGHWDGANFVVPLPASIPSTAQEIRVTPPGAPARVTTIPIRPEGQTNASFALMTPVAPAPSATLRILGMVPGGIVTVNGVVIDNATGRPEDAYTTWVLPLATSQTGPAVPVSIHPPTGADRQQTIAIAATGATNLNYATMPPVGAAPGAGSSIEVSHIPTDSRLFVDGVDVSASGRWVDFASRTFAVPAAPGLRSLRVHPPTGTDRAAAGLSVPPGGAFSVDYNTMAPIVSVTPDSSRPTTSIHLMNAPAGLSYALDGLDVTPDVRCVDLARRAVEVPALPGPHNLRITPASGPVRAILGVQVPMTGFVEVDYNTMRPLDDSGVTRSTGRIVVRGAPPGISPARVLTLDGVAGDPAQSQPLTLQPGGYLAVTWPVGPARIQVGAFEIPVSVTLAIDSVYDYSPTGLTFQPLVTDARLAPLAGQAQATPGPDLATVSVELRALPDEVEREVTLTNSAGVTFAMTSGQDVISEGARPPGSAAPTPRTSPDFWRANVPPGRYLVRATSSLGRVRTASITTGPSSVSYRMDGLLWSVAGQGAVVVSGIPHDRATGLDGAIGALLGNGSRYLAELAGTGGFAGEPVSLRPLENGDLAGYVTPGAYTLTVFLETSNGRQAAVRSAVKRASVNVVADQLLTVAYADMPAAVGGSSPTDGTAARNAAMPVDENHSRLTVAGLGDGWTVEVDGASAQPDEGLTRGPHTIVLTNAARGLSVSRQVVLAAPAETVDVSFDVSRAGQFASGKDGLVNITEDGLRNGYPAQITSDANARLGWLTPTEERRVMREFDVVGAWRDANGRMPVAVFHKGLGMVVVPMTPAELLHLARNFTVKRGKIRKDGYYAVEFQAPSAAAALASVLRATAPAGAMLDDGRYGVRYGGPPAPDWV